MFFFFLGGEGRLTLTLVLEGYVNVCLFPHSFFLRMCLFFLFSFVFVLRVQEEMKKKMKDMWHTVKHGRHILNVFSFVVVAALFLFFMFNTNTFFLFFFLRLCLRSPEDRIKKWALAGEGSVQFLVICLFLTFSFLRLNYSVISFVSFSSFRDAASNGVQFRLLLFHVFFIFLLLLVLFWGAVFFCCCCQLTLFSLQLCDKRVAECLWLFRLSCPAIFLFQY